MKGFLATIKGKIIATAITAALIGSVATTVVFINLGYRTIAVKALNGITQIFNGDKEDLAYEGLHLKSGDNVNVNIESDLTLALDDDKYVYAEPETKFWIEAAGKLGDTRTTIHLEEGSQLFRIDNKLEGEEYFDVQTPNSTMSVRGTVFRVTCRYDENGELITTVEVFEGEVLTEPIYLTDNALRKKTGDAQIISANHKAKVRADESVSEFVIDENGEIISELEIEDYADMPAGAGEFLGEAIDEGRNICVTKEKLYDYVDITECVYDLTHDEVASTCIEEGHYYPKCSVCGKVKDDIVMLPLAEHNIIEEDVPATVCGQAGVKYRKCSDCGTVVEEIPLPVKEHSFDEGTVTKNATNKSTGIKTYTCTDCGEKKEEEIPKLTSSDNPSDPPVNPKKTTETPAKTEPKKTTDNPVTPDKPKTNPTNPTSPNTPSTPSTPADPCANGHAYVQIDSKEATCAAEGYVLYRCSVCSKENKSERSKKNHQYVEDTSQHIDATCSKEGKKVEKCSSCGDEKITSLGTTAHKYVDDQDKYIAPTCTDYGYKYKVCSECKNESKTRLARISHDYKEDPTKAVAATCTEKGKTVKVCSNCLDEVATEVPALGHDKIDTVTTEATCEADGLRTVTCSRCTYKDETVLPALGHSYILDETKTVLGTCTDKGSKTYKCTKCNKEDIRETETVPDNHDYVIVALSGSYDSTKNKYYHKQECSRCADNKTEGCTFSGSTCTECGASKPATNSSSLKPGSDINQVLKEDVFLGGNHIEEIKKAETIPAGVATRNIANEGETPVSIWVDGDGILNFQSESEDIVISNAEGLFSEITTLKKANLSFMKLSSTCTSLSGLFNKCENLISADISSFDTKNVTDMSGMFKECKNLSSLDITGIDTSNVTNMSEMFYECKALESFNEKTFDTSKVENMSNMWYGCDMLTSLDLSGFDTRKVTDMSGMFEYCPKLKSISFGTNFDTSHVTDMNSMFHYCRELISVELSGFNTSNVTDMNEMFYTCSALTSIDVSGFDTKKVTNMKYMFGGCSQLTALDLSNFDTSGVTQMMQMFHGCSAIETIYTSENFKVQTGCIVDGMFGGCSSLTGGKGTKLADDMIMSLYITNGDEIYRYLAWMDGETTGEPYSTEKAAIGLTGKGLFTDKSTHADTSVLITGPEMNAIFKDASFLKGNQIESVAKATSAPNAVNEVNVAKDREEPVYVWVDNAGVLNFYSEAENILLSNGAELFKNIQTLKNADISFMKLDSSCRSLKEMFYGCNKLVSLDLSGFNTANVTDMSYMFYGCDKLVSLDLSNFNTASVTDMSCMFFSCDGLTSLDLSSFNTVNVTSMVGMFTACGLTSLDLSSFNTVNVIDMWSMFQGCTNLTKIYAGAEFTPSSTCNTQVMFKDCNNLAGKNTKLSDYSPEALGITEDTLYRYLAWTDGVATGEPYSTEKTALGIAGKGLFTDKNGPHADTSVLVSGAEMNAIFNDASFKGTNSIEYIAKATSMPATANKVNIAKDGEEPVYIWLDETNTLYFYSYAKDILLSNPSQTFMSMASLKTADISFLKIDPSATMMYNMFSGCERLQSVDLSSLDLSNIENMSYMFNGCFEVSSIIFSETYTSSVTDLNTMFYSCAKLTSLDLSYFDIYGVSNMESMFSGCSSLRTVYVSNAFLLSTTCKTDHMFNGATMLMGGTGTKIGNFNTSSMGITVGDLEKYLAWIDGTTIAEPFSSEKEALNISGKGLFTLKSKEGEADSIDPGQPEQYGIIANSIYINGHIDSNIATKSLKSTNGAIASGVYLNQNPASIPMIIGEYDGGDLRFDSKDLNHNLFATKEVQIRLNNKGLFTELNVQNSSASIYAIDSAVDSLRSAAMADGDRFVAGSQRTYSFSDIDINAATGKYSLSIVPEAPGDYVVNLEVDEEERLFGTSENFTISLNSNQRVLFNISNPGNQSFPINRFTIKMDGNEVRSSLSTTLASSYTNKIYFYCSDRSNISLDGVLGTFILPNSKVSLAGTGSGLICADEALLTAEWHQVDR